MSIKSTLKLLSFEYKGSNKAKRKFFVTKTFSQWQRKSSRKMLKTLRNLRILEKIERKSERKAHKAFHTSWKDLERNVKYFKNFGEKPHIWKFLSPPWKSSSSIPATFAISIYNKGKMCNGIEIMKKHRWWNI